MFIYLKGTVKNILGGKKDYNRQVVILQLDEEFGEGTVRLITNKNYKVGEQIKIKIRFHEQVEELL